MTIFSENIHEHLPFFIIFLIKRTLSYWNHYSETYGMAGIYSLLKEQRSYWNHYDAWKDLLKGVCCVTHIKALLHLLLKKKRDPQKKCVYTYY
jgi:hypothetical protein